MFANGRQANWSKFILNLVARALILTVVLLSTANAADRSVSYDVLQSTMAPYSKAGDPFGFPLKVATLAESKYKFWRGSKDLFYRWSKSATSDWLGDPASYIISHGDLHPGNIGSYAVSANRLAIGWVDFDDSARLPFQLELLHGVISFHLIAEANDIPVSELTPVIDAIFTSYRSALSTGRTVDDLLTDERAARKLKSKEGRPYDTGDFLNGTGDFRPAIVSKSGKMKEILRPVTGQTDAFANAIWKAIEQNAELRSKLRFQSASELHAAIKSIALRTRIGSSGSQGLNKYLVLFDRPIAGVEGDVLLYLKQQLPSAAERSGIIATDDRTPAARTVAHMTQVLDPQPWLCEAVELNGQSYWLSIKEPWTDEFDAEEADTAEKLANMARIWGTSTGATHARSGNATAILGQLTSATQSTIAQRAIDYTNELNTTFATFQNDERVKTDIATVRAAIERAKPVAQDNAATGANARSQGSKL